MMPTKTQSKPDETPTHSYVVRYLGMRGADSYKNLYPGFHIMKGKCMDDIIKDLESNGGFSIDSSNTPNWIGPTTFIPYHNVLSIQFSR